MQKKARELARTRRRQGKWREHAEGKGNGANMQKIKELARDQGCFRRTAVNCDGLQRNGDRSEWQRSGRINLWLSKRKPPLAPQWSSLMPLLQQLFSHSQLYCSATSNDIVLSWPTELFWHDQLYCSVASSYRFPLQVAVFVNVEIVMRLYMWMSWLLCSWICECWDHHVV